MEFIGGHLHVVLAKVTQQLYIDAFIKDAGEMLMPDVENDEEWEVE